ncbi:MAG: Gfo/Idh/MocA family oxidoreductase [Candidatus Handelsmanbacteria bacterium]|nr:Gfo/Idh/MocA family oxidoreductase [Candidatus Handelsmanbacteria bacterium]
MAKLRFGIIGCGDIAANSFAPSLLKSEHAELVAVCRRDLEKARAFAARFGGCAAYAGVGELMEDPAVEAVVVSTPTDTHCSATLEAARLGKHVLCEKPMAHNAAECRGMIEACRAAGVKLGVAYRRRLFPQVVKARELIAQGRIGRVVCARTHYSGWSAMGEGNWRIAPKIGGAMMEMAVHRIEVLLNFAGQPVEVAALVETVHHGWPVDDSDALLLRFADGVIGLHSTILTSPPRRDFAQIDGTEGRLIIDSLEFGGASLRFEGNAGAEEIGVTPLESPYFDLPMIDDFVGAVRQGREPVCGGLAGYWTQAVVDAAFQSAREKRHVAVEPWG